MENPFSIQQAAIGLTIWNPTNEVFEMQYSGISLTMKPGDKEQFDINCARHLLNSFGQRGLTSLSYGSDEERIGKEAIARNIEFKQKQVVEYNQRNEGRKQMGMGYLPPTPHVKKYAIELGLELLEPYAIREEERNEISSLKRENKDLKMKMDALLERFDIFLKEKGTIKKEHVCEECGAKFDHHLALAGHKRTHEKGG